MKNLVTSYILILLCCCKAFAQQTTVTPASANPESKEIVLANPKTSSSPLTTIQPTTELTKTDIESLISHYVRKDEPARITRFETAPVIDG